MEKQFVHLFVFNTLADWETGYAVAGINNPDMQKHPGRYQIQTVGLDAEPITTIGGITILPDITLDELEPGAMLILPGVKPGIGVKTQKFWHPRKHFWRQTFPLQLSVARPQDWLVLAFWMTSRTPAMLQSICKQRTIGAQPCIKINLLLQRVM